MLTIPKLGGVALLLAGSTWLWLTPAFASPGVSTSGVLWGTAQALSMVTVVAFCLVTWALFTRRSWWKTAARGSAALGLITLVPYWVAARGGGEAVGTATWNVFVHVLMGAGVLMMLRLPQLERWVDHHVMSH